MRNADVLVVGGGLGGCIAALAAVEAAPDAEVALVAPREHPFDDETALVDVLGYPSDVTAPVVDPFEGIDSLPDDHVYRRLGVEALRSGLSTFDRATAGTYAGAHTDANALVPTAVGGCRPVARYPAAVEPGLLSRTDPVDLVGFQSVPDFDPFHAVERLRAAGVPFDLQATNVQVPVDVGRADPGGDIARALDENATVGKDVPVRESAARAIRAYLRDSDRVGVPAVLGLAAPAAVHATFAAELDADVFEVPLGSAGVLGRRLGRRLADALAEAEVSVHRGVDVAEATVSSGRVERVRLEGEAPADAVEPSTVVLATGGAAAGGIVAERDDVREPRFGCPVEAPADRTDWTAAQPLDSHAMATFGVEVDADARPTDSEGAPVAGNLYAAGRVVGGSDYVAEQSVGGVCIATGDAAGRGAARGVDAA